MTPILAILAQASTAPKDPANILGSPFVMMGVMLVVFYFLLVRPQQLQRKQMAERIAALQAGDKVVTTAGLHGIVHKIKEHTVVIKADEGTMLEFDKSAVAHVHKKETPSK
jgi:preprotein translocase subunit YajC